MEKWHLAETLKTEQGLWEQDILDWGVGVAGSQKRDVCGDEVQEGVVNGWLKDELEKVKWNLCWLLN